MTGPSHVTVGIPFYNAAHTLPDAIRSVFAQSFQDWELVLVDDGSTDHSLTIARTVMDDRVRVVSDGHNRGLAHRLNQITGLAQGPFVARMDADDLMHPERLARQLDFLSENPRVDVVGTATFTIYDNAQPVGIRGQQPVDQRLESVLERGLLIHPTVMMRTAWARANQYSLNFPRAEDHELWCRVCSWARISSIATPLLFYREPLPINVDAYLKSCRSKRQIVRKYGPASIGRLASWRVLLKTICKEWVYRAATVIPAWQPILLRRRSSYLPEEQRAAAAQVIMAVRATSVPGWDQRWPEIPGTGSALIDSRGP